MFAIYKRELKSYFTSPIGYVFIAVIVFCMSIAYAVNISSGTGYTAITPVFSFLSTVFIFVIPIFTMRLWTEERNNHTEKLLLTSPTGVVAIVFGKYLAAMTVYLVPMLISFMYVGFNTYFSGSFEGTALICPYIGTLLLGASYIAVGFFISTLFEKQWLAGVVTALFFVLMAITEAISFVDLSGFSLIQRYDNFYNGLLDFTDIIFYLSFIALAVWLTIESINKRRID